MPDLLSLPEDLPGLLAAWDALAEVAPPSDPAGSGWNPRLRAAVERVLTDTVLDPSAVLQDPWPKLQPPAARRGERSAAHPRGFLGTKHKPPKRPAPEPLDLRRTVCSPVALGRLLEQLESPPAPPPRPPWQSWPLRALDPKSREGVLAHCWSLGLEQDPALRRAVTRLLVVSEPSARVGWLTALSAEKPARRTHLAELILESFAGCAWREPPPQLGQISRTSRDGVYRHRLYLALSMFELDLTFFVEGCSLANLLCEDCSLTLPWGRWSWRPTAGLAEPIVDFMSHVLSGDEPLTERDQTLFAVEVLWKRGQVLPGLGELLRSPFWRELRPAQALALADGLTSVATDDLTEVQRTAKWDCLRGWVPRLGRALAALPAARQSKANTCLKRVLWWVDDPADLEAACERALVILPRLCGQPSAEEDHVGWPLCRLLEVAELDWEQLLGAAEPWQALDRASARGNDALLLASGLQTWGHVAPRLLSEGLLATPAALFRAARTLGSLPAAAGEALLRGLVETALFVPELDQVDLATLVAAVDAADLPQGAVPIRRQLRRHLRGQVELRPGQLEGQRQRILAALPATRVALVKERVFQQLAARLGGAPQLDPPLRHALLLQGDLEHNRRGLRRLIRAHLAGHGGRYVTDHPANQAWLARHPILDPERWRSGIRPVEATVPEGKLSLGLERDPLEVLRLGTHVGSCFGLGGAFADSAAAVALDINKAVVYARDAQGTVQGRQLLAVAKDDRLVGFAVYPGSASAELRQAFRDYDEAFAAALGLELYRGHGDEPEVELVVVRDWYDDGAWNLALDAEGGAKPEPAWS